MTRIEHTLRGRNAIINVFELWVGLAGIISGIVFFYSPAAISSDAISETVGRDWSMVWNVGYFLAGVGIWWGLLRPSPRAEVAALSILGGATAIQAIAIASVFGIHGAATITLIASLSAASWFRAAFVARATAHYAHERNGSAGR